MVRIEWSSRETVLVFRDRVDLDVFRYIVLAAGEFISNRSVEIVDLIGEDSAVFIVVVTVEIVGQSKSIS